MTVGVSRGRPERVSTRLVGLALLATLTLGGCGQSDTPDADEPVVIATTTMLGSVVTDIARCAGASSETLMAPGDDPHSFSLSSEHVADLVNTQLVVSSGLGLEEGMTSVLASAQQDGAHVLEVAPLLNPLPFGDGDSTGQLPATHDPHFWLDVARMADAAAIIGHELATITGDSTYATCGTQVRDDLLVLDTSVRDILAGVEPSNRVLVTDHNAFGYFAAAYGFEIAGVVIAGGSTEAEPSSRELAALIETIQTRQIPAIFSNIAAQSNAVEAVAREAGPQVQVVPLYVGSLGPAGSGAETYASMMTTNAELIAQALEPK